jgi:hypothetical protein
MKRKTRPWRWLSSRWRLSSRRESDATGASIVGPRWLVPDPDCHVSWWHRLWPCGVRAAVARQHKSYHLLSRRTLALGLRKRRKTPRAMVVGPSSIRPRLPIRAIAQSRPRFANTKGEF